MNPRGTPGVPSRDTQPAALKYMSGIQALVHLPMMQQMRDAAAGLNTAGFISGYRGSPLGGLDQALWKAQKHLEPSTIHFQPGVNEELAATAVWGTPAGQPVRRRAKYDGVFALWYGKGPGVDRSGTCSSTATPPGTRSTAACWWSRATTTAASPRPCRTRRDHVFIAAMIPVLDPVGRAGVPRLRPARLGDVALFRLLGRR